MISVLDALLAPIARLAVAKGLTFPQVAERLKLQFLKGAEAPGPDGKPVTDSRISVMTGLQRRDITRLRALPGDTVRPEHPLSRLVAVWQADYSIAEMPRTGDGSFAELAGSIRKDVHPRTLLEQLVAAGTVEITGDTLSLRKSSYQPLPGSEDQLTYLEANGGDYLTAAVQNVMQSPAPFFERAVHYNGLSPKAVAELDDLYRAKAMQMLQDLSHQAARLQADQPGPMRFRAGGYFYAEDET